MCTEVGMWRDAATSELVGFRCSSAAGYMSRSDTIIIDNGYSSMLGNASRERLQRSDCSGGSVRHPSHWLCSGSDYRRKNSGVPKFCSDLVIACIYHTGFHGHQVTLPSWVGQGR